MKLKDALNEVEKIVDDWGSLRINDDQAHDKLVAFFRKYRDSEQETKSENGQL